MAINAKTVLRIVLLIAGSRRVMAVCLIAMIFMVISGTLYETSQGLLAARELFFESWVSFAFGVIPFPGIKLAALILLINLLIQSATFLRDPINNSGLIVIHCGVAMLLAGTLIASKMAHEYVLPLGIGQTSDTVLNYNEEELVVHRASGYDASNAFTDTVIPVSALRKGGNLIVSDEQFRVDAIGKHESGKHDGTNVYKWADVTLSYSGTCQSSSGNKLIVNNENPTQKVLCEDKTIIVEIRPATKKIPVHITLKDFTKQLHQGTRTLKHVQSNIVIKGDDFVQDAVITMNKPLRFKNYTFYQSSYSEQQGKVYSSFSVVYNPYKITPYIASLTIICGGMLHVILLIIAGKRKRGI